MTFSYSIFYPQTSLNLLLLKLIHEKRHQRSDQLISSFRSRFFFPKNLATTPSPKKKKIGRSQINNVNSVSSCLIQGWVYVIVGSHFVPLEGKFLLIAIVIVRITLNVIVRQIPLNVCPSFKNLSSNSQILQQCYFHL